MTRLIVANLLMLLLVGLIGLVAVIRSTQAINYLNHQIAPAVHSNAAVLQDLTDAETNIRGWSLSGEQGLLDRYGLAAAQYSGDQRRLVRYAAVDAQLAHLVDQQKQAAQAWFDDYAFKRLRAKGGVRYFNQQLFDRGFADFNALRDINAVVAQRLSFLSSDAQAKSDNRLHATLIILILTTLAGTAFSLLIAQRSGRRIVVPLMDLHDTVARLADGDLGARARLEGPVETVRVASSLNGLAQESERSRAVESEILEQLRDLDSVKTDFVSNVSHELRTPLTSIGGYVELLEGELGERLREDEREMLHATKRNVNRLRELIEDLLTLTRAESRGTDLKRVVLGDLLREVVTDLSIASGQRGVALDLVLPSRPLVVLADASQIARAITNLVTNAVKYSHGSPRVSVTLEPDGEDALITVVDRGIGIPPNEMPELGSRFYRASNAVGLGISGTGLGLRIVQAILENHHGGLELESLVGEGTTARMRLPLQADSVREQGGTQSG